MLHHAFKNICEFGSRSQTDFRTNFLIANPQINTPDTYPKP